VSTRLIRRVLVLTVLIGLPACGKKDTDADSDDGSGSPGPSRVTEPGVPAPPLSAPRASGAAARARSANNLRQIGFALHSVHDVNGYLPAGYYDRSGKGLGLSWRVAILPYIEQGPLWQEFHLDEPWNSEHNKKLIAKMPKQYAPPGDANTRGYTYYRSFSGPGTFLHPTRPTVPPEQVMPKLGRMAQALRIAEVTDGISNTIMVAEAYEPVVWTKPDELEYAADKPLPKLGGSVLDEGFHVLMGDATTRFFSRPPSEKLLRAMITTNGGETIDLRDEK